MKPRLASVIIALAASVLPFAAAALAVSEVEVLSNLNQPLDARIRLLAVSQAELDSLSVQVRGDSNTDRVYVALRHVLAEDENGHYIRITTQEAVREPILTVVLEAAWSTGKLTREYSIIIDPQ